MRGTGYTNHCPQCLWSKHVDISPGDRGEKCQGLMEPVRVEGTVQAYVIIHRCTVCQKERRNRVSAADSADALVQLAARTSGTI